MDPALVATLAAAASLVGLASVLVVTAAWRHRLEQDLRATRADVAALRVRLDEVASRPGPSSQEDDSPEREYVITTMPDHLAPVGGDLHPLDAGGLSRRDFASVALVESVVRVSSLAHGVRRALSAESRNRIRFEMGREVKRSRRQRRREVRHARRHLRRDEDPPAHHLGPRRAEDAA
jgi:hypothetical protein